MRSFLITSRQGIFESLRCNKAKGSSPLRNLVVKLFVNSVVAKTDMGKPLFKASDGSRVDILR
jgi:hypothetical protein